MDELSLIWQRFAGPSRCSGGAVGGSAESLEATAAFRMVRACMQISQPALLSNNQAAVEEVLAALSTLDGKPVVLGGGLSHGPPTCCRLHYVLLRSSRSVVGYNASYWADYLAPSAFSSMSRRIC